MSEAILSLQNIHKSFGQNEILKGIDFELKQGEKVVILGPSGSGKSTILRCINHLEEFQKGTIHFKGKKVIILGFLITQMLPVSVLLTPLFITFQKMHLYNTWWSTIISDATIGIPFSVLILKNFFASIPKEIEEASYIDGCNKFTGFVRVLIPIAKPGVTVCGIFSFLYGWGDLAYGMTFILDQERRPITAGIFNFIGQYGTKWSYLTAFAIVTIIPVAIIFIFMQKYIISGMTSGAVKG